jgi:hypothetical protein
LFVATKGKSNDIISKRLSKGFTSKVDAINGSILGNVNQNHVENIVDKIDKDGFYVFPEKASDSIVDELVRLATELEAQLIPRAANGLKKAVYDRSNVLSPRYQFDEKEILKNKTVQSIVFDEGFYAIAQTYLKCIPIQDLTAMWWSAPFTKEASSEAAQLYHFDMDRFKFIKFFIYLTDVDSSNGPHCYVRGSHKFMPDQIWKDGRIQDAEINKNFSKEDIIEITGKKGSIIAVDTRGLHKGKVLESGERLILQVEYTNSLFGATFESIDISDIVNNDFKRNLKNKNVSFQRFKL